MKAISKFCDIHLARNHCFFFFYRSNILNTLAAAGEWFLTESLNLDKRHDAKTISFTHSLYIYIYLTVHLLTVYLSNDCPFIQVYLSTTALSHSLSIKDCPFT